jgi:endonuclease-3
MPKKSSKSRSGKTHVKTGLRPVAAKASVETGLRPVSAEKGGKKPAPQFILPDENPHQRKKRALKILDNLAAEYPDAKTHLDHENAFQLLISTILAAQCYDSLVNRVMGPLYKTKYKRPADFLKYSDEEVQQDIMPITFFRNKTRAVKKCCQTLIDEFNGEVPDKMEDLVKLAGVGRKNANVVLGNWFKQPAIITDTHVIRVSQRLGLTDKELGDKVEADLLQIIPTEKQTLYSLTISEHGRKTCHARKPKCPECAVNALCPSRGLLG